MRLPSAVLALLLATGTASADEHEPPPLPTVVHDDGVHHALPRDVLASLLADQAASVDRAVATITDKVTALDADRIARARAAYRVLHAPAADPMASARRRAAIRLVLGRDADERAALVAELAELAVARSRIAADTAHLAELTFPTALARVAHGEIARHFGILVHERSKATLARRGIDLEVDSHAVARAPARGSIRYAGPIRGLDRGVVIDHGDYYSIVAKLGDLTVPVGAVVEPGDKLGTAARHRVYFEIRMRVGPGGLPIDPEPLFGGKAEAGSSTSTTTTAKRRRR